VGAAIGNLAELRTVLVWLDFAGVAVFAVTGALVAAQTRQDIITTCFFAVLTGIGGGTVRDILIGAPVFWIVQRHSTQAAFALRNTMAGDASAGGCRGVHQLRVTLPTTAFKTARDVFKERGI